MSSKGSERIWTCTRTHPRYRTSLGGGGGQGRRASLSRACFVPRPSPQRIAARGIELDRLPACLEARRGAAGRGGLQLERTADAHELGWNILACKALQL